MKQEDEVRETAAVVHAAVSLFTRRARETKASELSLPERTALSRLDRNGPDTIAGLARWEEITPQAVGVTISSLAGKGLLEKSPDPSDGRRSILTITPEGVTVVRAGRGQLTDRLVVALESNFTSDELHRMRHAAPLLERLAQLL